MSNIERSGTFPLGSRVVKRLGYGAMRLSGPGIFGVPRDRTTALAVLREAVSSGVTTSIRATTTDHTLRIS